MYNGLSGRVEKNRMATELQRKIADKLFVSCTENGAEFGAAAETMRTWLHNNTHELLYLHLGKSQDFCGT